jgi:hypothetical protein
MERKYGLHAVIIKNNVSIDEAKALAKDFIQDKNKHFVRFTKASYRFRNISKQKFYPSSFRTKRINKQISLVFGELKPEWEHLEGSGILSFFKKGAEVVKKGISKISSVFKPRLDGYNNTSTSNLTAYGDLPITSLTIYRTPIMGVIDKAINIISLGKWGTLKNKYGFDEMFHLALIANVGNKNIVIEKNEVININTSYKTSDKTETLPINLTGPMTINEMLNKGRASVGDNMWFSYDAFKNNCQYFIKYCLEASGLYDTKAKDFLFQDITELTKEMPEYVKRFANVATTTGAIINKITGQGQDKCELCGGSMASEIKANAKLLKEAEESFYQYVLTNGRVKKDGSYNYEALYAKWLLTAEAKEINEQLEALTLPIKTISEVKKVVRKNVRSKSKPEVKEEEEEEEIKIAKKKKQLLTEEDYKKATEKYNAKVKDFNRSKEIKESTKKAIMEAYEQAAEKKRAK